MKMKKSLALLLALLCVTAFTAAEATETIDATPPADTQGTQTEGEADTIEVHRYESVKGKYYFYIPTDWFFIGRDAYEDDLKNAREALGEQANELLKGMTEENDIVLGISKDGKMNVSISYRPSSGATSQSLIDDISTFTNALTQAYTGLVIDEESGAFKVNELYSMLYIGYQFNGQSVRQYMTVMGENMYVITFTDTDKTIAETLIANGFGVPTEA